MNHDKDANRPAEDLSPYAPPKSAARPPDHISDNPSVFEEPWLRADKQRFDANDGDPVTGARMAPGESDPENSVWDEPGLSRELAGDTPHDGITWLKWFQVQAAQTTAATTWGVTLVVAISSGICAIFGAIFLQLGTSNQFLVAVVAAPITEEIMKIALAVWVCEKRPWLFRSPTQILLCGLASGFVFAAIENVLYLNFGESTPSLVAWRWTVCVLLHVACSLIASIGVVKIWTEFQKHQRMPQLADGAYWFVAAMVLHGTYNLTVTLLAYAGVEF